MVLTVRRIEALGIRRGLIVLEPVPRSTAGVARVAGLIAEKTGGGPVLLCRPTT